MNSEPLNYNELGFLVSSPVLMLARGRQKVKFKINFTASSYEKSKKIFEAWSQEEQTQDHGSRELKFIIKDAFKLFVTVENMWREINGFTATLDDKKKALIFSFGLLGNPESLVPLDNEIHEGNFESEWPCVKIVLNNDALIYPYKFLEDLVIKNISIKADVAGVTDLELNNNLGKLDNSIPFPPFGPIPHVGSYLRMENPLILQKNLTKLKLNFEWCGLPEEKNGFIDYYAAYNASIHNGSFKAVINQSGKLVHKLQKIELFESNATTYSLEKSKSIKVKLEKLEFNDSINLSKGLGNDSSRPLYIILESPEIAFGHQIFPTKYSEAAMFNARIFKRKSIDLPKQPYTPLLDCLTINYTNYVKESISRKKDDYGYDIKLIHFNSFGNIQVFPHPRKSICFLLPQIRYNGNILVGLNNLQAADLGGTGFNLSYVIHATTAQIHKPKLKWDYLNNKKWVFIKSLFIDNPRDGILPSAIENLSIESDFIINDARDNYI